MCSVPEKVESCKPDKRHLTLISPAPVDVMSTVVLNLDTELSVRLKRGSPTIIAGNRAYQNFDYFVARIKTDQTSFHPDSEQFSWVYMIAIGFDKDCKN